MPQTKTGEWRAIKVSRFSRKQMEYTLAVTIGTLIGMATGLL